MTKDEALLMCLEYIETDKHERKYVRQAIRKALAQPEPVTLVSVEAGPVANVLNTHAHELRTSR